MGKFKRKDFKSYNTVLLDLYVMYGMYVGGSEGWTEEAGGGGRKVRDRGIN